MSGGTRASTTEAFNHLIGTVFEWTDSTDGKKALTKDGYKTITNFVTMTIEEVEDLTTDGTKVVPRVQRKLLLYALLYYDYESRKRTGNVFNTTDWIALTKVQFEDFRATKIPMLVRQVVTMGMPATTTHGEVTSMQVNAFVASHRRDVKSYKKFNGKLKLYFRTIRQWSSQARVDGVERIFDKNIVVPDPSMEDYRLWTMQQAYIMSVLTYVIDGGQALTVLRYRMCDERSL